MKHLKKYRASKVLWIIGIVILFCPPAFAYWVANCSPIVFNESCDSITPLNQYVAEGAGYYLDAYSDTLIYMKKTEWSEKEGLNYDELKSLADNALSKMEKARAAYVNLTRLAGLTPYNQEIIERLKNFPYDEFQKANGLNPGVFSLVKTRLSNGDIRKVYYDILANIDNIIGLLKPLKDQAGTGIFPTLNDVWRLNQAFSQTLLYGQYVAQVFDSLANS